ncbi:hypothetical protein FJZ33_10395 [Candidatus Poribacteria bacterium]|nr:hypothetical protein [Candidatus Poribacteria bacterium]
MKLLTAYVYEESFRASINKENKNYWYEYIREINEQLGLRAKAIPLSFLEDEKSLKEISILFIGDFPVSNEIQENIDNWVKNGGVLISFATAGLDKIFGNTFHSIIPQPFDDYTISGYFSLQPDKLTTDIHSYFHPEQKLIIFSDIRCVTVGESVEIAHLYWIDKTDAIHPAITRRNYGKGQAYYFAFNVPQTLWVLHQGIPITYDRDNDGYYRTGDLIAIGDNEREVLYGDEILFLIQNMIAQRPQPLIYAMPPREDKIPDAMFYWGGDDEASRGTQLWASNWVKEKGLPYHINIMQNEKGEFTVTKEEAQAIIANGHEPSLHYNFIDNFNPLAFTEADIKKQADAFYNTYGFRAVCSVNHWCRWTGWAETAKWMYAAGGKADNSFIHHRLPPMNPANRLGFAFGTCFPFYFYDDYKGENKKIEFLEEPITAYEVGYSAANVTDFDIIHKVVDIAANYHLVMDMFYHPINVYNYPACRAAIEEVLRYIEEKGIIAVHRGNDGLWEWWDKRSKSQIWDVVADENQISFDTYCEYHDGMIVKVPIGSDSQNIQAKCDENRIDHKIRRDFGQNWVYLIVPEGKHKVYILNARHDMWSFQK